MKKFVCCICLLLGAICTTAIAQEPYNILKIEGMVPQINGTTIYYIKNVGTGLHVSYGAEYGKHCKESRAAHPFVLANNNDGTVALGSLAGYLESESLWMDWAQSSSKWTLQPVGGEYVNQYYIVSNNGLALTSVGNSAGLLRLMELDYKASQRFIFLTEAEIRTNRMPKATPEKPFDVTPFIKGAAFDLADGESVGANPDQPYEPEALKSLRPYLSKYWSGYDGNVGGYWPDDNEEYDPNLYNFCGIINGEASAYNITYQVTLPAGTYSYSFEGFYEYVKRKHTYAFGTSMSSSIDSDNGNMTATVTIAGGEPIALRSYGNKDVYNNGEKAAVEFRDNDNYKYRGTFKLNSEQTVSITIYKGATSGETGKLTLGAGTKYTYPNQIFIDNFTLLYFGPNTNLTEDEVNDGALFDSYLDANIDEFIESLPEEEQEAAREALENLDRDNINSTEDYYNALKDLEESTTKVEEDIKEEAVGGVTTDENGNIVDENGNIIEDGNANLSSTIKNPSFEKGTLTGWTMTGAQTSTAGVRENKADLTTQGADGKYLFYAQSQGASITQTIEGLPKGVYKMTVSLASNAGNTIILRGNDNEREVTLTAGAGTFEDFSVKFRVTDGTATIGIEGSNGYKADHIRLELLNDHLILDEKDVEYMGSNQSRAIDYWYANVTLYRTIKANGNWNTFIVPFDIPASSLGGWTVKELTGSEMDEAGNITLTFEDAENGIEAGVPYLVRNENKIGFTQLDMKDVTICKEPIDIETEHVTFCGVWTKQNIDPGCFYISNNKFYRSVNTENPDIIQGYRAYFRPKDIIETRSLGYRIIGRDEEGATDIDEQVAEEATVVAIYTLDGKRIDEMQQGVNILQMSDGSVVKVVIK